MKGLGLRLKTLRKNRKMTQEAVATLLNIHRTTYTKYEKEHAEPSLDVVCALSEIFEVTVDELLKPRTAHAPTLAPAPIPTAVAPSCSLDEADEKTNAATAAQKRRTFARRRARRRAFHRALRA